MIRRLIKAFKIWRAWKRVDDRRQIGLFRYENSITGDRRLVMPSGVPLVAGNWVFEGIGKAFIYDRQQNRFFEFPRRTIIGTK